MIALSLCMLLQAPPTLQDNKAKARKMPVAKVLAPLKDSSRERDAHLRRVATERGRYGEVLRPTNEAYEPDYQLAGPLMTIIFPVGEWQRRYYCKPIQGTLASTWKSRGHVKETWYANMTGTSDRPMLSGIGTLDALLGRNYLHVLSGANDAPVLRALNKKQAYAVYIFRILADRMMYFFVDTDGNMTEDRDAPYEILKSPPYPITPEERDYLAHPDVYLGSCSAEMKLEIFRLLSDPDFGVWETQSSGIAHFYVRRGAFKKAQRLVAGKLKPFRPLGDPDLSHLP